MNIDDLLRVVVECEASDLHLKAGSSPVLRVNGRLVRYGDGDSLALMPNAALQRGTRQDPDVILVGEMRDLETIATALTAAETGHLVFATLHTPSAPQSIDRVIDVFPPHQQNQIRAQLSTTLQAVLYQALIPRTDGNGRVAAVEVMIATTAIRNLIPEELREWIGDGIRCSGEAVC
jgi:twitching motility protein PilT